MKPTRVKNSACFVAGVALDVKCTRCGGTGVVTSEAWKAWAKARKAAQADGREAPPMPDEPEEVPCPICDGCGRLLTVDGVRLLEFIKRWSDSQAASGVATCRVCGCTEDEPCEDGCWWVEDPEGLGDLCSNCLFELRDRFNEAARDACFRCAASAGLPGPESCGAEDICRFWPDRPEAQVVSEKVRERMRQESLGTEGADKEVDQR